MRVLLIMTAALGLAGCPEGPTERQARDELERLEKERDAAATEDVFSGLAPSADLGAAPDAASTPAAQQTCAGMNDAVDRNARQEV